MSLFDSKNYKIEEKYDFQRIYSLIENYAEIRDSNNQHLKRLKDFEIPLESSSNFDMSIDIVNSPSHAASDSIIMFIKLSMSNNQTHKKCRDKWKIFDVHNHKKVESKNSKSRFIPTCHHCDIIGHIRPNYF